ncbi:MAG TPA: metallophosphoesterase [Bacteroidales bacterium]|nr:metallophosphoesterase [Bacteroidales bacterium]
MKNKNIPFIFIYYCFLISLCFPAGAQPFSFVHISDVHVSDGTLVGTIGNDDPDGEQFSCSLQEFNYIHPKPAFVVVSGDISNVGEIGSDGMYDALVRHLYPQGLSYPDNGDYYIDSAQTIPIYFVPGNHEYYEYLVPPIVSSTIGHYEEYVGPDADYTITHNNTVVAFLRTGGDRPIWQDMHPFCVEGKGITDAQCQWLRTALNPAGVPSANTRKIIVMHHPVVNVNGTEYDGSPNTGSIAGPDDGSFLYNRQTFMNICDSNHVDVVLAGHVHQFVVADRNANVVTENWSGGTRYCQTAQEFEGAYRIITVDSNIVSIGSPSLVNCLSLAAKAPGRASFKIYPNPFTDRAILQISGTAEVKNYDLRIFDVMGRVVKSVTGISEEKTIIERDGLVAGVYFYLISDFKGKTSSGKLIITD